MIRLSFAAGSACGPVVHLDGEDVTDRCQSVELLPGRRAVLTLLVEPFSVDYSPIQGSVLGLNPYARLRTQKVEGAYEVDVL